MGTKNNPGAYDCYAKIKPDEPYFVLRGCDPDAVAAVKEWIDSRHKAIADGRRPAEDFAKLDEAWQCMRSMVAYQADQNAVQTTSDQSEGNCVYACAAFPGCGCDVAELRDSLAADGASAVEDGTV